jgi:dTDP-4-dehydrorhamnose reductase
MLGSALMRQGKKRNLDIVGLGHDDMDITNETEIKTMASAFGERTVINAAGIVRSKDDNAMLATNSMGPYLLSRFFPRIVQISTDCVFNGNRAKGYTEKDAPCPSDHYGVTKASGELIRAPHLTIRGSFIGFGPGGFLDRMILSQDEGATIEGYTDWQWNGLYVEVFANIVLYVAQLPMWGVVHISGGEISKAILLKMLAVAFRPDLNVVATTGGRKDMILRSNVFTGRQISQMLGQMAGGGLSWHEMIRSMKDDYSHHSGGAIQS